MTDSQVATAMILFVDVVGSTALRDRVGATVPEVPVGDAHIVAASVHRK